VLGKQDVDEMKYPSQNEFILDCFRQLIQILPFKPVFIADREFGCERFIRFLFRLPRGRRSKWRIFQTGAMLFHGRG